MTSLTGALKQLHFSFLFFPSDLRNYFYEKLSSTISSSVLVRKIFYVKTFESNGLFVFLRSKEK